MFVVIFRARQVQLDARYSTMAAQLRERALTHFGCLEFVTVTEGEEEIALSYWASEQAIQAWRQDSEHQVAQALGKASWYQYYSVEVAHIQRRYQHRT